MRPFFNLPPALVFLIQETKLNSAMDNRSYSIKETILEECTVREDVIKEKTLIITSEELEQKERLKGN